MKSKILIIIIFILATLSISINFILLNTENIISHAFNNYTASNIIVEHKSEKFENGDQYNINRFRYKKNQKINHFEEIHIKGNEIVIRYINPITKEKINTSDIENITNTTLLISTNIETYLISIPAVYKSDTSFNTLSILKEKETPLSIKKK